jgi:ribonuclease J
MNHSSSDISPSTNDILMIPLGGAGEIGMNMTLYGYDGKWILVDCGVTFPDDTTPGVDLIMADPSFLLNNIDNLAGVVITHAHEDHIGALPILADVLQCPLFATPFAAAIIQEKINEQKIKPSWNVQLYKSLSHFQLGPFSILPIPVTHSTLEAHSLAIKTPLGTVVHTGDWKIDPTPLNGQPFLHKPFEELGNEGVLACVCDSTNIFEEEHSKSEKDIRHALHDIIASIDKGRIAFTCFASNLTRIESAMLAGHAAGRHISIAGRSMQRMIKVARSLNYLKNIPDILPPQETKNIPPEKLMLIVAGCQGEHRGTMTRLSLDSHRDLSIEEGDTVIFSSREIPGNEKAISRVYNNLAARNIHLIKSHKDLSIHGSGHASKGELKTLHQLLKPSILIPVHGEYTHLQAHQKVALSESLIPHSEIIENGFCAAINQDGVRIVDSVDSGRWFIDESRILDDHISGHQKRRALSLKGTAFLSVFFNPPQSTSSQVSLFGIGDDEELSSLLLTWCNEHVHGILSAAFKHNDDLEKSLAQAFKKELFSHTGKRHILHVHILTPETS